MTGSDFSSTRADDVTYLNWLLDHSQPASVLHLLPPQIQPGLVPVQAQALIDQDCYSQARQLLETWLPRLEGPDLAKAEFLWVQPALRLGWIDQAILAAEHVAQSAVEDDLRASALAWSGLGYAQKHCWVSAENALHRALELAPLHPPVMAAYGRLRLEADQRIAARQVYHNLGNHPGLWAQVHAGWGISYVAYLLGEFETAWTVAQAALGLSSEAITPLYVMAQVALVRNEESHLQTIVDMLTQRSPNAEGLAYLRGELARLHNRLSSPATQAAKRLSAFPTMVQRRDYCGPSTVELVLRYWKNDLPVSADQIAGQVKYPFSGSPIYRIRDFFHLVGFDTIRTLAPLAKLKQLVDAGIPAIIQQEYANSSHVSVVIGYDDQEQVIELQDPMTHTVVSMAYDEFNRLRRMYLDSAVIAFPRRRGLDKVLARLDLFNNPAVIWTDQAVMELDQGRPEIAAELMEKAVRRLPGHRLSWMMLLYACLELWRQSWQSDPSHPQDGKYSAQSLSPESKAARQRFFSNLAAAKKAHPKAEFIALFEGSASLFENKLDRALAAFKKANQLDPQDGRTFSYLAECYFALRQPQACLGAARSALEIDAALPAANVWMGRVLAATGQENAFHYAQAALELAPDWWLSHLAMAEVYYNQRQYDQAASSLDQCQVLSPANPEALTLRALLAFAEKNFQSAVQYLQELQPKFSLLCLAGQYNCLQLRCRILYEQERYDQALEQSRQLLDLFPQDPWGLQFMAAMTCENLLTTGVPQDIDVQSLVIDLYEKAIQANQADSSVVSDYLQYLELLVGSDASLDVIQRLQQAYPQIGRLVFLSGRALSQAGEVHQAGEAMLLALQYQDAITNRDELNQAVQCIYQSLGAEDAEHALAQMVLPLQGVPAAECSRSLGLVLAAVPSEKLTARRLLTEALARQPSDAQVMLRLGELALSAEEQENAYRQALILEPGWSEARSSLATFLLVQNRPAEALELTRNYTDSESDLEILHAQALFALGQYELAARLYMQINDQANSLNLEALGGQWLAELKSGWYGRALSTARKASRLVKRSTEWMQRLAIIYSKLQRFTDAYKMVERAKAAGLDPKDELRLETEFALAQQDYPAAQEWVDAWLAFQSQMGEPVCWGIPQLLQFRIWVELGRQDEASQLVSNHKLGPMEYCEAATTALDGGAPELALALSVEAIRLQPDYVPGMLIQARALVELSQEPEALEIYQRIRLSAPDEHSPYEYFALKLAQDGRLDEALELADRSLTLGAYCPRAWAVRGLIHFLCAQPAEALSDLETAWNRMEDRLRQRWPVFWLVLFHLQGKPDQAQQWHSRAYHTSSYNPVRRLLPRLEPLLDTEIY